jgi:hypothetical protein
MREGYRCTHRHPAWGRCGLLGGHGYRQSETGESVPAHAAPLSGGDRIVVQRWDDAGTDWPEPDRALAELPWAEDRAPARRGPRGQG